MPSRRTPRLVAAVVAACALLLALPAPAGAHAYLVRTDPGDGATLRHSPHRLTLSFSEHVVLDATRVEIVDGDGRPVPVGHLRLATEDAGDTEAPAAVVATLPDLPVNTYRVSWETLSSDDLHATTGFFVFGVGRAVVPTQSVEPVPRVEESALRWLLLLGVALVLGSALTGRLLDAHLVDAAGRRRLGRLARAGSVTALLGSVALLLDQVAPAGLDLSRVLAGGYGVRWAWRETGLVLLAAGALLGTGAAARRWRRALLTAGTTLTVTGTAALGHAGGTGGVTRLLATSAHLLAVTAWAGGVLCILALVAPPARPGARPVAALRAALRSFALPAGLCVSVAVVTGIYLSSTVVVSVDALVATTYGRTLLVKVAVVTLMGVAGLVNHRRLRGRHDLDLPRRTMAVEALLGVAALAAGAVLASGQPATEPEFLAAPPATRGTLAAQVADLQEAVRVRPNVPGRNVATVDVFDTRRPSPGPVTGVDVHLDGTTVAASPLGDGHWTATFDDLPAGPVSLDVTVHRAGLRDLRWQQPWVVGASQPERAPVVSMAPVQGPLRGLAAALALVVTTGWAWSVRRRRRGRPSGTAQVERETVSSSA